MGTKQNQKAEIEWDKLQQRNFENTAFNPTQWIQKAVDLLVTAKRLEQETIKTWDSITKSLDDCNTPTPADHLTESYFMIISFAIENLFKAKIVQNNENLYRTVFRELMSSHLDVSKKLNNVFPDDLKTHDLFALSKKLQLALFDGDEDLLRRLSLHATWAGRYPSPVNHKHFSGLVTFSDGKKYYVTGLCDTDVENITKFVASLPERLGLHISHKWPIE